MALTLSMTSAAPAWSERELVQAARHGDELMFQTNVMNFTSRLEIARHGFQSVTLKLAHDYPRFKRICARHGIEISATRVRKVVKHFEAERESTGAWRKILEQTTSTLLRESAQQ